MPTEKTPAIMWRTGERGTISDLELRLQCVELATKSGYPENGTVDLAQQIYDFVTDQK